MFACRYAYAYGFDLVAAVLNRDDLSEGAQS
jgi:hypothetical protein